MTQGDTLEQVLSDMGTNNPADLRLVSSPGRRFLEGRTLQGLLAAGHDIWFDDEYENIRRVPRVAAATETVGILAT